jgi:hypothetical protein
LKLTSILAALAATVLFSAANLAQAQEAPTKPKSELIQDRIDAKQKRVDALAGKSSIKKMAKKERVEAMVALLELRKQNAVAKEAGTPMDRLMELKRRQLILAAKIQQVGQAANFLRVSGKPIDDWQPLIDEQSALLAKHKKVSDRIQALERKAEGED